MNFDFALSVAELSADKPDVIEMFWESISIYKSNKNVFNIWNIWSK